MAIALVAHIKPTTTGPSGCTTGALDTTGANFLVATLGCNKDASAGAAVTDNKGNTWTALTVRTGTSHRTTIFYVVNPTVGTGHTFSCATTNTYPALTVAAFSGVATTSPFDQQNGAIGSASPLSTGSITPTAANELIIAGLVVNSVGAMAIGSGLSITDQVPFGPGNNYGGALAYLVQTSAAAINPGWTFSTSADNQAAVIASFKAAGPPPDVTAPTISAVAATSLTDTSASIGWTTNEAADSQVEYGTTVAYGSSTTLNPSLVTSHTQVLSGLTAATLYHYRVKSKDAATNLATSADFTFTTETATPTPAVTVRRVSSTVTFAGVVLADVLSARGQVAADSGWPTCSVFVTGKPPTGNEENDISVVAGAGNNVTRFVGKVRRFRPSAFPKGIEIVSMGTLAYAAEWAPSEDILFDETFPSGATDEDLVQWALSFVPGVTYVGANIEGTGITLGIEAWEAFDWKAGTSAWAYVQALDQATLYRTYQQQDGTIRRVRMIGHPSSTTTSFTLGNQDILEGSTGERNTEQTRNAVVVRAHNYGGRYGVDQVLGTAYGFNDFQLDATDPATRHPEQFSSDLIEGGNDEDGISVELGGLDAQAIADAILDDVNKEFVQAQIRSWRDDTHGPGLTCDLDTLDRLAIGEKMWVQGYAWEVDDGWSVTYSLSGGGLEQPYTPPPI